MIDAYKKLAALSMDLKRVALGYHSKSNQTASRFVEESLKKIHDINSDDFPPYLQKLLANTEHVITQKDKQKVAEDALMYSTLLQNAALNKI